MGPVTISGTHTVITATSPLTNTTGAVDLRLTMPGGVSATGAADRFTYTAPAPTIAAISPLTGSTAGSTTVTITGSGLLDGGQWDQHAHALGRLLSVRSAHGV